jgi:PAS domain S-box-containing protein
LKYLLLFFVIVNLYAKNDNFSNLQKINLQLNWKHQFEFAGFYAAKEKGFYKDVGLNVDFIEYNHNMNIVDEVINEKADYGLTYSSLIIEYMKGKSLVLIANFFKQSPLGLATQYNNINPDIFNEQFYDMNLFTTKKELTQNPTRINNFRKASIKGWEYALKNKEEIIDIIIEKYNTQNKSREDLLFESKEIEYLILRHIYPIGSISNSMIQMISDQFAKTFSLENISKKQIEAFVFKPELTSLELNDKEKEYLLKKKILKLCIDPNWLPLEKIEQGKHIGISAEFIQFISQKLDIPIQLVETKDWTESLEKIKEKKCDILSLADKTPLREDYLNFTSPYLSFPFVIATSIGLPFINNLQDIGNRIIAVSKNYAIVELLKNKYPNINLIYVNSAEEGISLVAQNKAFGFIDNSIVLNNEIQKSSIREVSINGQFSELLNLRIASRNDEQILNEILEKALLSIDETRKKEFLYKWSNISYQLQYDYYLVFRMFFIGLVIASIFIYWNFKLKEEINNTKLVQELLMQSEEKFRTLFDIAPILLDSFDKDGKIILWNKECEKTFGWTLEELQKEHNPLSLFYPDSLKQKEILDLHDDKNINIYKEQNPVTKDGKTIIIKWSNIKLPNNEVIHIGYDITQQKNDEKAIIRKNTELEDMKKRLEELNNSLEERIKDKIEKSNKQQSIMMHQSKLVQMGEMIENIAHQWRQPLSQINSAVLLIDTALIKNKFSDTMVEYKLNEIEKMTEYMSRTIDNFKDFFNPNKEKHIFFIEEAVIKANEILKGLITFHQINIIINIKKNLECFSYIEELEQVILIILNNAIDALLSMKITSPKIYINAYTEEENIFIDIMDNALGINSNILDKIFDPYFTTKSKTQGTGLGLYMAKMIIENGLIGSLSVKNNLDGACFTIKIPKGEKI